MNVVLYIAVAVALIIVIVRLIELGKSALRKQKKSLELMMVNGSVVRTSSDNRSELDQCLNAVLKPLETYINGPDQSMRSRHDFTPLNYVRLPDGLLFQVWVQIGYISSRPESVLHVAEFRDGAITHIVKADDYINNSGSFDGLANVAFENTSPTK